MFHEACIINDECAQVVALHGLLENEYSSFDACTSIMRHLYQLETPFQGL